ncbi:MAG: aldo/keto reductase, partial [Clostridiales bacterium]|nr:aldo/keto reductase [Clostridiales bacterium]
MQYTNIRGLRISRFTLGTVQLGMEYGIANRSGKPGLERSFEILTTALDEGVNCFDTANIYGNSEEILGKYFSSMHSGKKPPLITTKFKIDPAGDTSHMGIEKQMYGLVEKSLHKIKIRAIPVYMLHNAKDMSLYGNAVRETLEKMKTEGLIEKAGVSVYNPEEVEEML